MHSMKLRLSATVALIFVLLAGGCSSSQPDRSQPKPMPKAAITAEGHYAAGQFHESAIVTDQSGRATAKQLREARRSAIKQYEAALKLDETHAGSLYRLAVLATEDQDLDRAAGFWRRYVKATDGSAVAWRNLAVAHDVLGEAETAEEAYRHALAADADDDISRVNLGMLLARAGRLTEAREQLSKVLAPAAVHFHVAQALQRRGQHAAAATELRAAAAIDSRYATASLSVMPID